MELIVFTHMLSDIARFLSYHLKDMETPESGLRFREAINSILLAKTQLSQALRLNGDQRPESLNEAGHAYFAELRELHEAPQDFFDPAGQHAVNFQTVGH